MRQSRTLSSRRKKLSEDILSGDIPVLTASVDNESEAPEKAAELARQASANGARGAKIKVTPKNATSEDNMEVSGDDGNTVQDRIKDGVDSARAAGLNQRNVTYTTTIGPDGKPVQSETRRYTKAQICESRIAYARKYGQRLTLKEIKEGKRFE